MDENTTAPDAAGAPETVELHERQCWELLRRVAVGRLAVITQGRPDIFPVNHVVDHGTIVFRTSAGTKLATAVGHPVAYEVDGWDDDQETAWSVVVRGTAHSVLEREESLAALRLPLSPWQDGRKPWFVRIEADEITGRRLRVNDEARHHIRARSL